MNPALLLFSSSFFLFQLPVSGLVIAFLSFMFKLSNTKNGCLDVLPRGETGSNAKNMEGFTVTYHSHSISKKKLLISSMRARILEKD